jgi:hypothetical protein
LPPAGLADSILQVPKSDAGGVVFAGLDLKHLRPGYDLPLALTLGCSAPPPPLAAKMA